MGDEDLTQQFYVLEQELLRPATRSSRRSLEELLAEDFMEFASTGETFDREGVVSALMLQEPYAWSISNFGVKPLAGESVLVTYMGTNGSGESSLRCSVWRRDGGRWKMAFHQGTRIKA